MISATSAYIISSTKSSTFHDVVETLVIRIMSAIKARAEHQQTYCVYDIPVWMPGFACYDVSRVLVSVQRVLLTLGYEVHQHRAHHQLHISWKHANPVKHAQVQVTHQPKKPQPTQQQKTRDKKQKNPTGTQSKTVIVLN